MKEKLKVALVTPEFSPLARSGELADVASSLPRFLAQEGLEVMVFMPRYRRPEIESWPMEVVQPELWVPLGLEKVKASVYKSEPGRFALYLIDNPRFFYRPEIYGPASSGYLDNDARFIFFNRAVLEFLLQNKIEVNLIHCHNWPTALIPVFLRTHYKDFPLFKSVATVFTIHNAAYQGEFPPESLKFTGLNWDYFTPQRLSLNGRFNFLKAGLVFADIINTVSRTYKKEIEKEAASNELSLILRGLQDRFFSVRSGIDYEIWNPAHDPYLSASYTAENLSGKRLCKEDLIRELGLVLNLQKPLLGLVAYFSPLKGIDLVLKSLNSIMKLDLSFVICGQGDETLAAELKEASRQFLGRLVVKTEMSAALMHKIFAGCDLLLIPSREEPCGLNQFYAFRYGTIPVARAIGGLKETILPFDLETRRGNGFVFRAFSPTALLKALKKAISVYNQSAIWTELVKNVMKQDFSWSVPGKEYIQLYHRAIDYRKGVKQK
ncbi:MAG: glycogen synthase [Candidatus Aminicenantes bacterium]|nr:glycogen synthase [Candidatus Aminicenantes bacterium]